MRLKLYFRNKDEFVQYKDKIKLFSCPFCKVISTLVLYGPLKNKGHRCLCSNRFNKKGCGKTFSFLWGNSIKKHSVKANELWKFLLKLLKKYNISKAHKNSNIKFSRRAINHWLTKLNLFQISIRRQLIKITSPPVSNTNKPLLQTLHHLQICFPKTNPIVSYQTYFQRSIFEK